MTSRQLLSLVPPIMDIIISFVGVYQPELPTQAASFGEFLAFSNYYHVWQFLQLQPRSSLEQIDQQGQQVCSQNWKQMLEYNAKNTNVDIFLNLKHMYKLIKLDIVPTIINTSAYIPKLFCNILNNQ